jgi:hypothetical protein
MFFRLSMELIPATARAMQNCLGYIAGAKHLSIATLKKQEFVNPHIWELKKQQQQLQEQEMKVVDGQ